MRLGRGKIQLVIALVVALASALMYFRSSQVNPVTGEKQRVGSITAEQEIALGLQARGSMAQQFGGLTRDAQAAALVAEIGNRIVSRSSASKGPYKYEFHVLADRKTINAFALPGGQVFITEALLSKLNSRGAVAGVLGHEVAHVVARHGAEHIAKAQLTQGLTGAAVIATYDPQDPGSMNKAAMAAMIGQLVNLKYGREDELESDRLGVQFMAEAGYDPRPLIRVMEVLKAAGGGGQPEFFASHPNPENRVAKIEAAIKAAFPNGVPSNLEK
ncbi:MAG TPA: M48 family metallopeptidase [Fimbriimonadaceae bacterium]|nr:M48 family metallopeptidase [Fimbriimonadaceae bacterium]